MELQQPIPFKVFIQQKALLTFNQSINHDK